MTNTSHFESEYSDGRRVYDLTRPINVPKPAGGPMSDLSKLADFLKDGAEECAKHETCMSLHVSEEGQAVELYLDTGAGADYSDWIPGEGADIGLIRELDTNRVIGVRLPLLNRRLCVHYDGPIRINAGFRKGESP